MEKIVIYTDGASRGNPGQSSYGFVIYGSDDREIYKEGRYIGHATNNIAEYTAVVEALSFAKANLNPINLEVELKADSNLVIQQLSGKFKIKTPHIRLLINQVRELEKSFAKITYQHIPRHLNKVADTLANQALDYIV